jgi:hypothetical protein
MSEEGSEPKADAYIGLIAIYWQCVYACTWICLNIQLSYIQNIRVCSWLEEGLKNIFCKIINYLKKREEKKKWDSREKKIFPDGTNSMAVCVELAVFYSQCKNNLDILDYVSICIWKIIVMKNFEFRRKVHSSPVLRTARRNFYKALFLCVRFAALNIT